MHENSSNPLHLSHFEPCNPDPSSVLSTRHSTFFHMPGLPVLFPLIITLTLLSPHSPFQYCHTCVSHRLLPICNSSLSSLSLSISLLCTLTFLSPHSLNRSSHNPCSTQFLLSLLLFLLSLFNTLTYSPFSITHSISHSIIIISPVPPFSPSLIFSLTLV